MDEFPNPRVARLEALGDPLPQSSGPLPSGGYRGI
jgi:hypothetical protein